MSKYVDGINEENFDKFLAALRSGDFGQVTGRLTRLDDQGQVQGFCCLGVGSELMAREGVIDKNTVQREYGPGKNVVYGGQELMGSIRLMDWLGIPDANRYNDPPDGYNIVFRKAWDVLDDDGFGYNWEDSPTVTATELNDDMNKSFDVIADVFENEFRKEAIK